MTTIKIISGGYGSDEGFKDRSSAPFGVEDAEAEYLISIGVAEKVEAELATALPVEEEPETVKTPPKPKTPKNGKKTAKKTTSKKAKEDKPNEELVLDAADPV